MNLIQTLEAEQVAALTELRAIPEFRPGDTLKVGVKVIEGERSPRPDVRRRLHRPRQQGREFELHRPQDFVRRRRRARLPALLAGDRFDRGRPPRRRAPRQALLSARPPRQIGAHRRASRSAPAPRRAPRPTPNDACKSAARRDEGASGAIRAPFLHRPKGVFLASCPRRLPDSRAMLTPAAAIAQAARRCGPVAQKQLTLERVFASPALTGQVPRAAQAVARRQAASPCCATAPTTSSAMICGRSTPPRAARGCSSTARSSRTGAELERSRADAARARAHRQSDGHRRLRLGARRQAHRSCRSTATSTSPTSPAT